MIVHNLDLISGTFKPFEAYSPLIVDPYTVLPFSASTKLFQVVGRRNTQIVNVLGIVEHTKLTQSNLLDIRWQLS